MRGEGFKIADLDRIKKKYENGKKQINVNATSVLLSVFEKLLNSIIDSL